MLSVIWASGGLTFHSPAACFTRQHLFGKYLVRPCLFIEVVMDMGIL